MRAVTSAWLVGVHDELVGARYGTRVGIPGWVIRVGNTGSGTCQGPLPQGPPDSEAGPVTPCRGGGVGGQEGRPVDPFPRSPSPLPTLRARSVPVGPPW